MLTAAHLAQTPLGFWHTKAGLSSPRPILNSYTLLGIFFCWIVYMTQSSCAFYPFSKSILTYAQSLFSIRSEFFFFFPARLTRKEGKETGPEYTRIVCYWHSNSIERDVRHNVQKGPFTPDGWLHKCRFFLRVETWALLGKWSHTNFVPSSIFQHVYALHKSEMYQTRSDTVTA